MYELLGTLYKEMFQIFDPDVFHFGGDEVQYLKFPLFFFETIEGLC